MTGTIEQPLRDPWVPPAARNPSTTPPTEGAALRAQVEAKLKQAFDAADVNHSGTLTRQQAAAAGLGFIAQHFDAIDRQKTGAVRFDDVKRYLVEQGSSARLATARPERSVADLSSTGPRHASRVSFRLIRLVSERLLAEHIGCRRISNLHAVDPSERRKRMRLASPGSNDVLDANVPNQKGVADQ